MPAQYQTSCPKGTPEISQPQDDWNRKHRPEGTREISQLQSGWNHGKRHNPS